MSVSERIYKKREELGLNQTELAKKAGLKPAAISQYESGDRNPSYEAILKLSSALSVSTDYLISGKEINPNNIYDQTSKILFKITQNLSEENNSKLLEYAIFLSSGYWEKDLPILNETDYARYVIKNYSNNLLPIDVYDIAKKLNISIYDDDLGDDGEGILIKGKKKVIILNSRIQNKQRIKFTISMLIGHSIIPWHTKPVYTVRKSGTSTILTEDTNEMEAQDFAANLIMPQVEIAKDFIKTKASINDLKNLALEKYDVSLFAMCNRLVKYTKDKHAIIQSENWGILKTFPGNRLLVDKIHEKSISATFFTNPSSIEETRNGKVPAEYWLIDAKSDELIYEECIYNPDLNKVLTLLTLEI